MINGNAGARMPVDDRAVQYGDGVFETIAIRSGKPRFWDLHLERLENGCERLGIDAPGERTLRLWLDDAIDRGACDPRFAVAKIIVTAGQGRRGYRRPGKIVPNVAVGAFVSRPWPISSYRSGVRIRICQTRLAIQPQFAGIKSLNRLEQVVAQSEWRDTETAEGLMLDTEGRIICGTMSNVFLVLGNQLTTPAITRCGVAGVMRRRVIEVCEDAGFDYDVRDVALGQLDDASAVFLSNSQFGVLPVTRCGQRRWPVDDTTKRVMRALADADVPECRT